MGELPQFGGHTKGLYPRRVFSWVLKRNVFFVLLERSVPFHSFAANGRRGGNIIIKNGSHDGGEEGGKRAEITQ